VKQRRRHRHSQYIPLPISDQRVRVPQFVRLFTPGGPDDVRFPNLAPLPVSSAWSAIALISTNRPNQTAGLIAQQAAGARAFSVGLRDGCVVIEAATESRTTRLAPPVNQWSYVGVASATDGARVYLGNGPNVSAEDLPGLAVARSSSDAAILVGRIGETFSGAIAFICLFSDKLADVTMRSIVAGHLDPMFAPKLCFAWLTAAPDQLDMVSRRMPTITGTRIIPFASASGTPLFAPVAGNVAKVSSAPQAAKPSIATPVTSPAPPQPRPQAPSPAARPVESPAPQRPQQTAPAPKPTPPKAPPISEPTPSHHVEPETPEVIDPAAASKSALFRKLGLVDEPGEER